MAFQYDEYFDPTVAFVVISCHLRGRGAIKNHRVEEAGDVAEVDIIPVASTASRSRSPPLRSRPGCRGIDMIGERPSQCCFERDRAPFISWSHHDRGNCHTERYRRT